MGRSAGFVAAFLFGPDGNQVGLIRDDFRRGGEFLKTIHGFAILLLGLCCAPAVFAVPTYKIATLGFTGPEYTRNDGYKVSGAEQLNEAGQAIGGSQRYNGNIGLGQSAWLYNGATTINIGLTENEHTHVNGSSQSIAFELNESGQVRGWSQRFNPSCTCFDPDWGLSAWLYDGSATINVGLTGPEHTRNDGFKDSRTVELNGAGQVTGHSRRYNGGIEELGLSVWLYDGTTTIDIGLTGSEHTRNDGSKYIFAGRLNEAGQVFGHSYRYNGGSEGLGLSAWFYDGATTIDIGLTGSEHTRSDGHKDSYARRLNDAGQVIGNSQRYNGGVQDWGRSAWLYDGASTIDIGLTGSEFTSSSGFKHSDPTKLNESGQVTGSSSRYNGGSEELGLGAWFYDGSTTIVIGLTGSEHTRSDGYKFSLTSQLNETGQVIGYSQRYNCCVQNWGRSAWLYDGATTIDIGLTGSEHTRSDGFKYSFASQLNEAGQAIGDSERYNGGTTYLGQDAWLYDGATTTNIGLTGAEHTRNTGYKFSDATELNDVGQAIGYSQRYNGGSTDLGQDAWFYDPLLDQTFALTLSTRSDGYAFSSADYLGEDGLVVGTYTLFDAFDNNLGDRAFYFTVADGLHDLGSLVDGGLSANGWDNLVVGHLFGTLRANDLGQILGLGKLTSQTDGVMAYLLTPVIPEPSALILAMFGTMVLLAQSWRGLQ
jgi:hypothetical protein